MLNSEGVNEFGVLERAVKTVPIEAQSADAAGATASICNDEWRRFGGQSGHASSFTPSQALALT